MKRNSFSLKERRVISGGPKRVPLGEDQKVRMIIITVSYIIRSDLRTVVRGTDGPLFQGFQSVGSLRSWKLPISVLMSPLFEYDQPE